MVWTNKATTLLSPLKNTQVYNPRVLSERGLLDTGTWTILDTHVWWYDNSRILNVYDGGTPRRMVNPLHTASTERLARETDTAVLVANHEYMEVLLHYYDFNNVRRQLVYNNAEGSWYPFRIDRREGNGQASPDRSGRLRALRFGLPPVRKRQRIHRGDPVPLPPHRARYFPEETIQGIAP